MRKERSLPQQFANLDAQRHNWIRVSSSSKVYVLFVQDGYSRLFFVGQFWKRFTVVWLFLLLGFLFRQLHPPSCDRNCRLLCAAFEIEALNLVPRMLRDFT